MSAVRRSAEQIAVMRRAGRVVAEMHAAVREAARPGVTTGELDQVAREVLARRSARSNFLGYHGYPAVICASPNDVVVHGIPGSYRLADGDLLSVDCGAIVDGWHGDAAFSMVVGESADPEVARLIGVAEAALAAGVAAVSDRGRVSDIAKAVHRVAAAGGYDVVESYVGHGIGLAMHEEPDVPNRYPFDGPDARLRAGMCLAIEPILVAGDADVKTDADRWTVRTVSGALAAHVEHTIAITDHGADILTLA